MSKSYYIFFYVSNAEVERDGMVVHGSSSRDDRHFREQHRQKREIAKSKSPYCFLRDSLLLFIGGVKSI